MTSLHFQLFVLQHKLTGRYMPAMQRGRGYTYQELEDWTPNPAFARFMHSRASAQQAKRAWLKGRWEKVYETSDWDFKQSVVGATPPAEPPSDRISNDIEIVVVECYF